MVGGLVGGSKKGVVGGLSTDFMIGFLDLNPGSTGFDAEDLVEVD